MIHSGAGRLGRALRTILALALLAPGASAGGPASPIDAGHRPIRLVKLGGPADRPDVVEHIAYARRLGFDGFFVASGDVGRWSRSDAPRGPALDPAFVEFARASREAGLRVVVSVNPVADTRGRFIFSESDDAKRLVRFLRLLSRRARVTEFVVAFDDQPTRLTEIRDALHYGTPAAAPAHVELASYVARRLGRRARLWFCAAAYADSHLGDGTSPYARAFLASLPSLPAGVGIVWTGPEVLSPRVTAMDMSATRERLGGREILFYDNYPVNDDPGDALGLVLGPLRSRDPALVNVVAAYLACPMTQLGASRLPLATIADFLRDPEGYDPEASWARAQRTLAGPDPEVIAALETQATEWGGWIGELNYRHRDLANARRTGAALDDPAAVAAFTWTVERYPERIAILRRVKDVPFRDDLVAVMERRLAVARIVPLAVEYRARAAAGRADAAVALAAIADERRAIGDAPSILDVVDAFLEAAAIRIDGRDDPSAREDGARDGRGSGQHEAEPR